MPMKMQKAENESAGKAGFSFALTLTSARSIVAFLLAIMKEGNIVIYALPSHEADANHNGIVRYSRSRDYQVATDSKPGRTIWGTEEMRFVALELADREPKV